MDGVDGTKWHLLRSCPLTPSCQGQGSQFAFTGGQRPWWSLVSSGLSVAASFASLPRSVAQPSGSLHWACRDQRWAGSGYEDDVGSPGPG